MGRNILRKISFIIFGVITITAMQAQSSRVTTLKSCIDSALANYPSLKTFKKMEESKAAAAKSLQAEAYPELEFTFQGSNYRYNDYRYRTFDNRLNLIWNMGIWAGKLKNLGIAEEKIARFQSRQNRLQLIFQVKQAYFSLVSAKEEFHIARLSEIYLKHHLTITQKLFNLGQIDRLDLYFTQSELASAREKVLAAKSEIDVWQIQIANLTGLPISSSDSLDFSDEFSLSKNLSADSLLIEALHHSPMISILDQQIRLAKLQEKLIKSSRLPRVYLGGGYVFDNDPTSEGNYGTIFAGLQFPILDWGVRKNKAQTFRLQAESLGATRKTAELKLRTNLERLTTQMSHFRNLLLLKEKTIHQAQKTYDYTEINYQAGIATNTDVLLAQKALIAAKVSEENVIFTLQVIQSQIETLIGKTGVQE